MRGRALHRAHAGHGAGGDVRRHRARDRGARPADELEDGRLLRIDAFGRGGRVVGTWTQDGPCARYALLVDGRGRLIVAGSKDRDLAHAMYTVEGEGKQLTTRRLAAGAGILASAPWSNEKVVYLPIEPAAGGAGVQRIDLAGDGVTADVAECF